MKPRVYYNEIDPFAAEWMRWLIKAGEIPDGVIDTRSIVDVRAEEVRDYDQCHFFAGISGWPVALGRAGWPAGRRVWSGSCPCPPFSAAGRKKACPKCSGIRPIPCPRRTGVFICIDCDHAWYADGRHLYPEFHRLISECRPPVVYLEQVAGGDGLIWLAGVRVRLERSGYALGAADLPAACVGSPNIRQRLWGCAVRVEVAMRGGWRQGEELDGQLGGVAPDAAGGVGRVADADGGIASDGGLQRGGEQRLQPQGDGVGRLEHADSPGRGEQRGAESVRPEQPPAERTGDSRGMGDASIDGHRKGADPGEQSAAGRRHGGDGGSGSSCGVDWSDFDLVYCGDDKWRRIPRGTQPRVFRLADGFFYLVDDLRAECVALAAQEVRKYASAHNSDLGQVLFLVWNQYDADAPAEWEDGGPRLFLSKEVLFDFMCRVKSALEQGEVADGGRITEASPSTCEESMRSLRKFVESECSPLRQQPSEQRSGESTTAVLELSRFLARCCQTCWNKEAGPDASAFPRCEKVKGRVGVLRGFGNAINPAVAAKFIRLTMRWLNGERR